MRQAVFIFIALLFPITMVAQELSFYEMTASGVNLRECPMAQSRKLVDGEVMPEFANSGYTYHLPKGCVVYAIKQQGDWTQICADYCPEAWVMTKFLKKVTPLQIGTIKELRQLAPTVCIRTQEPYAGFCFDWIGGEFDEELFLKILANNALVTIDRIDGSCVDINETGDNSNAPLKIEKDEYGTPTVKYSNRHKSVREYEEYLDLDKLSKEEMEMLLNLFPAAKTGTRNAKPIHAQFFFSGKDEYGSDRIVTIPAKYLTGE